MLGSAKNVLERLKKHLVNRKGYTSKAKDWKLKHEEEYKSKSEDLKREFKIKSWKSRSMIGKLISVKHN